MAMASWMLERIGKRIDPAEPIVNARLGNGSVIHIIIPPLAHSGPCVTIRKPVSIPVTMADLIGKETLSNEMAQLLTTSVQNGMNILITGAKGAGKTTLLNALASSFRKKSALSPSRSGPNSNSTSKMWCLFFPSLLNPVNRILSP